MKKNDTKKIFTILLLASLSSMLAAQVTIGSNEAPVTGALLQLKDQAGVTDGAANAHGGIGFPRVWLTNATALFPMLESTVSGVGNANYNDLSKIAAQNALHTGLVVYSTNQCVLNGVGLYVWDGEVWQSLSALGVGVIEHPAKAGVYEKFTSASFGAAGRWMTTNLSAMAYDGNKHSTDPLGIATEALGALRTLRGPNETTLVGGHFDSAYWGYPDTGTNGSMDATEYNKNKALGYLYTWDAATAGKGGSIGEDSFGVAPNYEAGLPEGAAAGQQKRIQGICPAGWHLPSDYEWTLLENELQSYTSKYSSTNNIGGTVADVGSSSTAAIGIPMKSACKATPTGDEDILKGTSKSVSQGGFSALFAGYAEGPSSTALNGIGYFWSSSSDNNNYAWYRAVMLGTSVVYRYSYGRNFMNSVRCKKD